MRLKKQAKNKKNNNVKLDFQFLHSVEYFDGLYNDSAQKYASSCLQEPRNARKQTKQIQYNRF